MTKSELFKRMFPEAKAKMAFLANNLPHTAPLNIRVGMTESVDEGDIPASMQMAAMSISLIISHYYIEEEQNSIFVDARDFVAAVMNRTCPQYSKGRHEKENRIADLIHEQCEDLTERFCRASYPEAVEFIEGYLPIKA